MRFDIETDDPQAVRALAELRRRDESMEPAGSPAHAGIDPTFQPMQFSVAKNVQFSIAIDIGQPWQRVPRTRGDEPRAALAEDQTSRC